jgi:hypothetical protein
MYNQVDVKINSQFVSEDMEQDIADPKCLLAFDP